MHQVISCYILEAILYPPTSLTTFHQQFPKKLLRSASTDWFMIHVATRIVCDNGFCQFGRHVHPQLSSLDGSGSRLISTYSAKNRCWPSLLQYRFVILTSATKSHIFLKMEYPKILSLIIICIFGYSAIFWETNLFLSTNRWWMWPLRGSPVIGVFMGNLHFKKYGFSSLPCFITRGKTVSHAWRYFWVITYLRKWHMPPQLLQNKACLYSEEAFVFLDRFGRLPLPNRHMAAQ